MNKFRRIIGLVFLVLYMCHHLSFNFFYHTHYFSWGTVTHSHPYIPSGGSSDHTHTPVQCSFINSIATQSFFGTESIALLAPFTILLFTLCAVLVLRYYEVSYALQRGRSPPVY